MTTTSHLLKAGHQLTVSVAAGDPAVGVSCAADSSINTAVFRGSRMFGPYLAELTLTVNGKASVSSALSSMATSFCASMIEGSGAPASGVQASASVNPTGDDNALTFTAVEYGEGGNSLAVKYVDPGAASQSLAVSVSGNIITVSLETDGDSLIVTTAAEVLAAVAANPAAAALVTASIDTSDSGVADDGSGVVTAMALTTLENGAGTAVGIAAKGCVYRDTATGNLYRNTGTAAAPTWSSEVQTGYAAISSTVNTLSVLHLYGAGVPVDYTDGDPPATGEGTAPKGAIYSDITNGLVYRNSGSQAQPTWTALGDAA